MQKVLIQNDFVNWNKDSLIASLRLANNIKQSGNQMNIIEFGVYTGDSIRLTTEVLRQFNRPNFILGIDSFEGLPEETEGVDKFEHYKKGGFGDVFTKNRGYADAVLLKKWFSDLVIEDVTQHNVNNFDIVHMDCDLYVSTIDAFEFLLQNNLIAPGCIVTYDEFKSTKELYAGGECLAHREITNKYKIEFEEFFRNQYYDALNSVEFWQNAFLIKSIGNVADEGLINVENCK